MIKAPSRLISKQVGLLKHVIVECFIIFDIIYNALPERNACTSSQKY